MMIVSRKAVGLDEYPYISREPRWLAQSACIHRTLPVFLSKHWSRPATPEENNRSPTISGVAYGPFPISRATSLSKVIGFACSHRVAPVSAFGAMTISSARLPYMVKSMLPSTIVDEYPSPMGRFHITRGPDAGHES